MPKQKLIRLTSDSQDGVFSSTFNEDILIKKDSDIALQSLSVERKSDKIVISNDNNNIEYGVVLPELGVESTIIPSGVYDKNTNNRLLQSITNGLNRDASFTVNSQQMGTTSVVGDYNEDDEILAISIHSDSGATEMSCYVENMGVEFHQHHRHTKETLINLKLLG